MGIPTFIDPLAIAASFLMHTGTRKDYLTPAQKEIVDHPMAKIIILFGLFYISTRNLMWSIILVLLYYVLINVLLNETHPMNVLSQNWLFKKGYIKEPTPSKWNFIDMYFKNHEKFTNDNR